jgi:hypothetical protein
MTHIDDKDPNAPQGGKITFKLIENNAFIHWPCDVCGGSTEKAPILAETDDGLRMCERCLEFRDFDAALQAHAIRLEREAAELRGMIGRIEAPTLRGVIGVDRRGCPTRPRRRLRTRRFARARRSPDGRFKAAGGVPRRGDEGGPLASQWPACSCPRRTPPRVSRSVQKSRGQEDQAIRLAGGLNKGADRCGGNRQPSHAETPYAPGPISRQHEGPKMTTKTKNPSDEADFDPAVVLKQIALDATAPAGPRVAAARTLLIHAKAGKPTPEKAEREAASPINKAALRLISRASGVR